MARDEKSFEKKETSLRSKVLTLDVTSGRGKYSMYDPLQLHELWFGVVELGVVQDD